MTMPADRRIRYILESALRRIQESTIGQPSDGESFNDAFNIYVDMIFEFVSDGYLPCEYPIPTSIDDPVGQEIPQGDLISMLVSRIADFWEAPISGTQMSLSARAYERLASKMPVPKIKRNPMPVRYRFYDRRPVSCCHEDDCNCGCGGSCNAEEV